MAARGRYRTVTPESGAEYAYVDYGIATTAEEIPRAQYDDQGYYPEFTQLPTKEEYTKLKNYSMVLTINMGKKNENKYAAEVFSANTDDEAIAKALEIAPRIGLPKGDYNLQVVRDGIGIGNRQIKVC